MKIIRQPKVYLVGRQSLEEGEIERFLGDHDVAHWSTDTDVAGEKLFEIAGRVCYMRFAKPRPVGMPPTSSTSSRSATAGSSSTPSST